MTCEYSKNEMKLIKEFGLESFSMRTMPNLLFREMAIMCIKEDRKGPEVQAVRNAVIAIDNCSPYRLTDEFEKLIEF